LDANTRVAKVTPPHIPDSKGWPFKLIAKAPYKPTDEQDWRKAQLAQLIEVRDGKA
jgi:hypothetical protein